MKIQSEHYDPSDSGFGYLIKYEIDEYSVKFKAAWIAAIIPATPKEFSTINETEDVFSGFVKLDGCTEFKAERMHFCRKQQIEEYAMTIMHIYSKCLEFMKDG